MDQVEIPKEKKSLNPFAATFFLKRFIRQKRNDFDAKKDAKSQAANGTFSDIASTSEPVPTFKIETKIEKSVPKIQLLPEVEIQVVPEVEIQVTEEPNLFAKVIVKVNPEDMELPVKLYAAEKLVKWQKLLRRTASVNALALPPKLRIDSTSPKYSEFAPKPVVTTLQRYSWIEILTSYYTVTIWITDTPGIWMVKMCLVAKSSIIPLACE